MSDLISRQALMKEFSDFVRESNNSDFAQTPTWNDAVSLVGSMPSAQQWIPCSERLPEDRRTVLVTAYWHETYQVMEASYYGDGLWWCVPFNNCGKHMQRLKPIAWMPLPDPWKGDEDE